MRALPWPMAEGARRGLSREVEAVDDLGEALHRTLAPMPARQQVELAFAWLLGRAPDSGALDYHAAEMSRQPDGTRWLLDCLALAEDVDAAAPGEAELARPLLDDGEMLDDAAFLELAYQRLFGRTADAAGRTAYLERLSSGATNRPRLLSGLLRSEEARRTGEAASMASDWDARARENPLFFIASGASASEEEFRRSGEKDVAEMVLAGLAVDPSARAVEIGCGIGRLLVPLAARLAEVHGVDISAAMIERAREYCAGLANVTTSVTDGTLRQLADGSADLVVSYLVFQHMPGEGAIQTYLDESARVLAEGGLLRFQVDGRSHLSRSAGTYDGVKLSGERVRALLRRAGLVPQAEWGEGTHYYWLDARRGGAVDGAPVRLLRRQLHRDLLARLLAEGGVEGAGSVAADVIAGRIALRTALGMALPRLPLEPLSFVQETFRLLLARDPRPDEEVFHTRALRNGWADREALFDSLATCGPFRDRIEPVVPV